MIDPEQCVLTLDELCESLKIGKNTAYNLIKNKEIRAFKLGHSWRVPLAALIEYLNQPGPKAKT